MSVAQRNAAGAQVRAAARPETRQPEMDLVQLADSLVERENELRTDVIKRIENHRRWNENHVDLTSEPLKPLKDRNEGAGFRPATTQYLMTPPASETSQEEEPTPMELDEPESSAVYQFKGVSPQNGQAQAPGHQFRRRIGRLNRLWIDRRRIMVTPPPETPGQFESHPMDMEVDTTADRWKYDHDDSDDEPEVYEVDPYSIRALKFRSSLPFSLPYPLRRPEAQPNAGQRPNGVPQGARQAIQQRPHAAQPAAAPAAAPAPSS